MQKNTYPGKFIVIEGLDGSGKSSQVDLLVAFLKGQGKTVVLTREPTMDSEAGRTIKMVLRREMEMEALQLQTLYVQDRKEHLQNKVIPALMRGECVVSSRYAFSTFAYGVSAGLDLQQLVSLNQEFLLPDITVIVNVLPEHCIRRIEGRGEEKEFFEEKEKLANVNAVYQKLPSLFEKVVMVNGERSMEQVFADVRQIVQDAILAKGHQPMKLESFAPVFEGLGLTEADQHLILPFFTNLDKSVYGVTLLPPEVIGALCSRASRAKDDLRLAFLNEYVKPFLQDESEYSKSIRALIAFLHEHPVEQIFANPKAREFYIKWLAQFGDDSIAQMAGTHLGFAGISQLAIKHMEDIRLGLAPIEKSTRYVDYSSKVNGSYRYYTDPTLANYGLLEGYQQAMDGLFETYADLLVRYQDFLRAEHPGEEDRVIRTKAFDTVRLLLPVATLSQVAFFGNGQAFEYMINRGKDHKLGEVRWVMEEATRELSKIIPAFLRRVDSEPAARYRQYMTGQSSRVAATLEKLGFDVNEPRVSSGPVSLNRFDVDGEDKIIAGLIYRESHWPFAQTLGWVKQQSREVKEQILAAALEGRTARYYKVPRPFELADMEFEIVMNIGAWRDLHRHRIQTQMRQRFTIKHGYDIPEGLIAADLVAPYKAAIEKAEAVFEKIHKVDQDMAQYCCTMGHRVRFLQKQNARAAFWEIELRTTSQGHPDYRVIEQEKAKLLGRVYPTLAKHLMVDMKDYRFARREDSKVIARKEADLRNSLT